MSHLKFLIIFVAFLSLVLFYWLVAKVTTPGLAALATILCVGQRVYYDIVIEDPTIWDTLFQYAALLFFIYALENAGRKRQYLLAGSWAMLFLNLYSSFELVLACMVFIAAYAFWKLRWRGWRVVFFLGTAPVIAFVVHFANNAWVLGGLYNAFDDLYRTFLWRTVDIGHATYLDELIGGLGNYPAWLLDAWWNKFGFSTVSFAAVVAGFGFLAASRRAVPEVRNFIIVTGIFAVANITYWVVFPQSTVIEFNTAHAEYWLPVYGLLFGGLIYFLIKEVVRGRSMFLRAASISLVLLIGSQVVNNGQETFRFLDGVGRVTWAKELAMFRDISQIVPPGSLLLMEEDRDLARFGFLHQPRDAFGLSDFEMQVVKGAEDMERWEKTRQDQGVYFLVKAQSKFTATPRWEVASDLGDFRLFHLKRARV